MQRSKVWLGPEVWCSFSGARCQPVQRIRQESVWTCWSRAIAIFSCSFSPGVLVLVFLVTLARRWSGITCKLGPCGPRYP